MGLPERPVGGRSARDRPGVGGLPLHQLVLMINIIQLVQSDQLVLRLHLLHFVLDRPAGQVERILTTLCGS